MELYYQNAAGNRLNLNRGDIRLISMDGGSPEAEIHTSSTSGYDGSEFVSENTPERNITLVVDLRGDIEANRLKLYSIFRSKEYGTLFYKTSNRNVKIQCRREKMPFVIDAENSEIQISLLCPQPYFESLTELTGIIASVKPMFRFPFRPRGPFYFAKRSQSVMVTLNNPSEVDVGMRVVFKANGTVTGPSLLNVNTRELIKLDFTMQLGDTITVDTSLGKKSRILLRRNGVDTNIINNMADDFVFMPLRPGDNLFRYNADSGLNGLEVRIYYSEYYAGV